jgi:hypothetical protein
MLQAEAPAPFKVESNLAYSAEGSAFNEEQANMECPRRTARHLLACFALVSMGGTVSASTAIAAAFAGFELENSKTRVDVIIVGTTVPPAALEASRTWVQPAGPANWEYSIEIHETDSKSWLFDIWWDRINVEFALATHIIGPHTVDAAAVQVSLNEDMTSGVSPLDWPAAKPTMIRNTAEATVVHNTTTGPAHTDSYLLEIIGLPSSRIVILPLGGGPHFK